MHPTLSSKGFRRNITIGSLVVMILLGFNVGASAKELCPTKNSHELSAHRYKMFTAYQTAYDGYEAPCEMKCFSNLNCLSSCREKKGLESLSSHFKAELAKRGIPQCQTLSQVCVEECGADKKSCQSACKG